MSLETRWSEPALQSLAEVLQYTLEEHGERSRERWRFFKKDASFWQSQSYGSPSIKLRFADQQVPHRRSTSATSEVI